MSQITRLSNNPQIAQTIERFTSNLQHGINLAIEIQQIPSPTFAEEKLAVWVQEAFRKRNLEQIGIDDLHNVYGMLPGANRSLNPLIISAHTDTVFPSETDLTIRQEMPKIYGPGLADNSTGVAGLIWLIDSLQELKIQLPCDIWFVANSGEEGLGDLKGMRGVVERFGDQAKYIILEGGSYGHIIHKGIGVKRFEVTVNAPGGHSWADFGQTSAIHVMGHIIRDISEMQVPKHPKTTFNVGVVSGGTSINTIAQHASFLLDLRSESVDHLAKLVKITKSILKRYDGANGGTITTKQIGDRPAGEVPRENELVQLAYEALRSTSPSKIEFGASSTDANIPLSVGATAVCIGLATSGNVHRTDEYLDTTYFPKGMKQLLLLTLAASGYSE